MQNVEIYLSLNGENEKLYKTPDPSAFTTGPTGLPRTDIKLSLEDAVSTLRLSSSQYKGGDTIKLQLKLNLTNEKSYSNDGVTSSLTGSYFASPFEYNLVIKCIPLDAVPGIYTFMMTDTPYEDVWLGSHIKVTVDGKTTN